MRKIAVILSVIVNINSLVVYAETSIPEQKVVEIRMSSKRPQTNEEKKRQRKKSSTLPFFADGTCSGAFVSDQGDILTARHCVEGFDEFEVVTTDQQVHRGIAVAWSTIHDLALIHIDKRNTPFFELADSVKRGESISVLGSPLGITNTLSVGVVAKVDGDELLIDCSALPGNSGGPVFNEQQQLVGIVNAGYIVLLGTTHLNKAQGLDAIHFFLNSLLNRR